MAANEAQTQPLGFDLNDLITHRLAWREALVFARDNAAPASADQDDRSYWEHELAVFDRTFSIFTKA